MKEKMIVVFFTVLIFTVSPAYSQKSKPYSAADDEVYDGRIQQVKGKVVFIDKDNQKMPASGQFLVFRREGCEDCIVATGTDQEGNYKLFLGVGKYKLIVQFKNCGYAPTGDCNGQNFLHIEQPQYLLVERGPRYSGEFNINLVAPK